MFRETRFEVAEYKRRLKAVKEEMAKRNIDVLLVSEPPNQDYLTGYDAWTFFSAQMVVVALDRDEPIFVVRGIDRISAVMTTYLAEENIRGYGDEYVASATLTPYAVVADVVKEINGERGRIGIEFGGYYYSARAHADLTKALPQAELVDADLLITWLRLVKSPAELNLMRKAGLIADAMIARAVEIAAPGVRECDLAAALYHQQIAGTPDFGGGFDASCLRLCVSERALAPHANWTDKPLPACTTLNLEVHGVHQRYQVNLSRTISLGKPSDEFQRFADIALEALNAGLDNVRPGRTCSDVQAAYAEVIGKYGIQKGERLGYSMGLGYPPTVIEPTACLRKGDNTVLEPGMCFHLMAGLWLEGKSVAITQPFAVSETGFEPLTFTPKMLIVKT